MMELENICKKTISLTKEVGTYVKKERTKLDYSGVEHKGRNDLVTYVDKQAEEQLVDGLHQLIPEAGFITEEKTKEKEGCTYEWIIDPIDGTMNYVNNLPPYSISIALRKDKKVVLGVVYEMVLQECFYTWQGAPAYLNGSPIQVSDAKSIDDALLATGFPYGELEELDEYMEVFKYLMHHSQGIRRLGSAAVDLVYVACGRFEGFYEYDLNPWDVAAGSIIVQHAGGKVTDFSGGNNFIFGNEIVAACPDVHQPLIEAVRQYMK